MTYGRKTGGRDFVPGQSGNPNGRPPIPPDLKEIDKLTKDSYSRLLAKYMGLDREALEAIALDPKTPALDLIVVSIISKAIKNGDNARLEALLQRSIGPVPKILDIEPGSGVTVVMSIPKNGRELSPTNTD